MFKYNHISSKLLNLALLTIWGWYDLNSISAKVARTNSTNVSLVGETKFGQTRVEIDLSSSKNYERQSLVVSPNNSSGYISSHQQSVENQTNFWDSISHNRNSQLSVSQDTVFHLAFDSLKGANNDDATSSATRIIRIVSISFFLMLFVPFGIFYPFFLFYKKLLKVETDYEELADELTRPLNNNDAPSKFSTVSADITKDHNLNYDRDNFQATVSKLQIAFPAQFSELRQQLAKASYGVDLESDTGMIELLRKTISILLDRDLWTHVGQSSISVPLDLVKAKFEMICAMEKSKLIDQELNLVTRTGSLARHSSSNSKDDRNYVVVTLVLCTSHTAPLFEEIITKKQLSEILAQLNKMSKDYLIECKLLWNPQLESKCLSNNELLVKYGEMMRLF